MIRSSSLAVKAILIAGQAPLITFTLASATSPMFLYGDKEHGDGKDDGEEQVIIRSGMKYLDSRFPIIAYLSRLRPSARNFALPQESDELRRK